MNSNGREVALAKELVELSGTESTLDEDNNLIEFQGVEKLIKLSILLGLAELDVELLQTVKRELGLVVDVYLEWVLHEFLANGSNLLCQRGTEHHNLLLCGSGTKDVLNVATHI